MMPHIRWEQAARVGCISEASYTFVFSIGSVHDTPFVHPTLADKEDD